MWIMKQRRIKAVIHYLDDYNYLFFGDVIQKLPGVNVQRLSHLYKRLGVPVSVNKLEGQCDVLRNSLGHCQV